MRKHRAWIASAAALIGLSVTGAHADAAPPCYNAQLRKVLVRNADDATRIAFAAWRAFNPDFRDDDEKAWASHYTATLQGCIWRVAANPVPPRTYSTFVLSIGASDGRFLGAAFSD